MTEWIVTIITKNSVMPDELMAMLEKSLGKKISVVEVVTKHKPIPADFTASKITPTKA